jgi:hypothetical protein
LPDFVTEEVLAWACNEAVKKKNIDVQKAQHLRMNEGLCVQCMHLGSFDDEAKTITLIDGFIEQNGLANDIGEARKHHEIYLSDFRKTEPDKLKTVLRIPVKLKKIAQK